MNENNREKLKTWFFSDLMKSVNRYLNDWRIIYIDTLKHEDSLLQNLLDSKDWTSLTLSLCTDSYESLAPDYMSTEELREELESHREHGQLDVFYMEYMNIPVSREDATFSPEYFKYYEEADLDDSELENFIIIDPAKTIKIQSAETAIVGVGLDRKNGKIYVRDIVSSKMYPDEIYNEMFLMKDRLKAKVVGIEVTSLHEFIVQPVKNEMFKRGKFFTLIELKPRDKKEKRVAALSPFYRQGYIYHNKNCCARLEAQLLSFPRSKLWDIMDALAYIIEMMDMGDMYFDYPDDGDSEDEFKELDYDPPLDYERYV